MGDCVAPWKKLCKVHVGLFGDLSWPSVGGR